MTGKRVNQKQNPKIAITDYTDAKDYAKKYSEAASKLRKKKTPLTEEARQQKAEKRRSYAREYFRKLRLNVDTRRELNQKQWEYKKSQPHIMAGRNVRKQLKKNEDKMVVLAHYGVNGEPVCRQCGFGDARALAIDHINNDGAAHRKTIGNVKIHRWLIQNDFPEGFQTLCHNCNWIKEHERVAALVADKLEHEAELAEVRLLSGVLVACA